MTSLDDLRALEQAATPGPWHAFHVDDHHAMNCYGVTTDPDFESREDYIGPSDDPRETPARIVALTLYQAQRIVCHEAGLWAEDAALVVAARNALPGLLARVAAAEAERDAYREALEQITHVGTDLPHARRLDRDEMREIARDALAASASGVAEPTTKETRP